MVALKTHEVGIRMALGAQQRNILGLVLFNGFRLVVAGIFVGLLQAMHSRAFSPPKSLVFPPQTRPHSLLSW